MHQSKKLLFVASLAIASACVGAPDADIGAATTEAIQVPEGTEPLERYGPTAWLAYVQPDCEDLLPREVVFQLVHEGYLVALNRWGLPVCHDDVEDIQAELIATGRVEESRALEHSYLVAIGAAVPVQEGDPSPQPSVHADEPCGAGGIGASPAEHVQEGDPSPQPSTQACANELPPF